LILYFNWGFKNASEIQQEVFFLQIMNLNNSRPNLLMKFSTKSYTNGWMEMDHQLLDLVFASFSKYH